MLVPTASLQSATAQAQEGQTSATEAPKPGEMSAAESALKLEATKLKYELEQRRKEGIAVRRNLEGALEKERQSKQALTSDAEWAQRIRKLAPVDRVTVAKELWGEKWFEEMTAAQVNGGAPSAQAIAMEMDRREKVLRDEMAQRDTRAAEEAKRAQAEAVTQKRQQHVTGISRQLKASESEFPLLFVAFGDESKAAAGVFGRIEAKWREAAKSGQQSQPMTWKEAAQSLEDELVSLAEKAVGHEKYTPRFKEKLTPAAVSGGNAQQKQSSSSQTQPSRSGIQQSRTLSNDLTASTQVKRAAISDEEREQRARAAYEAALGKSA